MSGILCKKENLVKEKELIGLRDRNGREIKEGDKLKGEVRPMSIQGILPPQQEIGIVNWDEEKKQWIVVGGWFTSELTKDKEGSHWEIVGSIYSEK